MAFYDKRVASGQTGIPRVFRPIESPESAVPVNAMVNSRTPATTGYNSTTAGQRPGANGQPRSYGPGGNTYEQGTQARYELNTLRPQIESRGTRADTLQGQADAALADPQAAVDLFRGTYDDAMAGFANPFLRSLQEQFRGTQASTASRFGGNYSEEEARNLGNVAERGQRELSEAAARNAGAAVDAGMNYINQQQQAGSTARSEQDRQQQMALQAMSMIKRKKKGKNLLGQIAGTALQVAPSFL